VRTAILLIATLALAGGGGFYLLQQQAAPPPEAAPAVAEAPKPKEVYVPAVELSAGAILKPEHLGRMPLEEAATTPEMVVAGPEGEALLVGSVARQVLPRGVPIARSAVVQPGDRGFLAAVLPQGKRAISIPITETAGISGLVLPGDRVDIILTYSLAGAAIDAEREVRASETVMENIRVLALDQRLNQFQTGPDGAPTDGAPPIARTATLQVSPEEAEVITLATSLGDLSMVLNSVHDGGAAEEERSDMARADAGGLAEPRRMTLDSDVTSLLRHDAEEAAAPMAERIQRIQVVRGATAGATEIEGPVVAEAPGLELADDAPAE
jgi:pilus assembly protein CpaB